MEERAKVIERYEAALAALVERLQEDYYVLAAVLYGSLARGDAWERSDIDLMIILRDGQERENRMMWIVEDDINISAEVVSRSRYKHILDGALQGSITHSVRSQSKLLFSKDASIEAWLKESSRVAEHDRAYQLLRAAAFVPYPIEKAQKWFYAKRDLDYTFLWILFAVSSLVGVEVVLNGDAPGREALDQAIKFNPEFFGAVYTGLIHGPKTEEAIERALQRIDAYVEERGKQMFKPVLDFLAEAEGPVSASELDAHFRKKTKVDSLILAYEWLARKGWIQKLSSSVLLTRKSQVLLEEAAYYFDREDVSEWE
jgi:uncharacterized protein